MSNNLFFDILREKNKILENLKSQEIFLIAINQPFMEKYIKNFCDIAKMAKKNFIENSLKEKNKINLYTQINEFYNIIFKFFILTHQELEFPVLENEKKFIFNTLKFLDNETIKIVKDLKNE